MAGFNIQKFSANMNRNGSMQDNKFLVEFHLPRIFAPEPELTRLLSYRASNVSIPGLTFDLQNIARYGIGPQTKLPTNATLNDIQMTFIDTGNAEIWKFFSWWMNEIFDISSKQGQNIFTTQYPAYYQAPLVQIQVFNNEAQKVLAVNLVKAFPISLSEIPLSWDSKNQLLKVNVKFSFRSWYLERSLRSLEGFQSGQSVPDGVVGSLEVVPANARFSPQQQQQRASNWARRGDVAYNNYSPEIQDQIRRAEQE